MAIDSYTSYRRLAEERPAKARRYAKSIETDLRRGDIAAGERARLADALRGITDGLHAGNICSECGRAAEHLIDGKGSTCARKSA